MSGGVDSAVTAALLSQAGCKCIGIKMLTYLPPQSATEAQIPAQSCSAPADVEDAHTIANRLKIPFHVVDLHREFEQAVVAPFVRNYLEGRTPNPCVLCNNSLKLGALLQKATELECEFIATGHYARVASNASTGRMELRRPTDRDKDQTYYLSGLTQKQLARLVCPLGSMVKTDVRTLARELGLHVHEKPDSQEICFVAGGDYREFLATRPEARDIRPGRVVTTDGRTVGQHRGVPYYTIGQRRGLGIASSRPLYVIDLLPEENLVVVGHDEQTPGTSLVCEQMNWVAIEEPTAPLRAEAQIRYRHKASPAEIRPMGDGRFEVLFEKPQRSITPGQVVVFYAGDVVLGGGWIAGRKASHAHSTAR